MKKIALLGNPNCGKTTLFNSLTGSNQSVGNWPGVTVEKKSGFLKRDNFMAEIIDLPGIYSLSTISLEEEIAARFVYGKNMDLIINIVDASNLERNLFLTYQLLDAGVPIIVALNCMDIIEKQEDFIDAFAMEKELGVPVVPIVACRKNGTEELIDKIINFDYTVSSTSHLYGEKVEKTIKEFAEALGGDRFAAIRFFEDGLKSLDLKEIKLDKEETAKLLDSYAKNRKEYDIDFDMVIPNDRYDQIIKLCKKVYRKNPLETESKTDKIDRVLTNRWLGLPIFAAIMFGVFYLAFGPVTSYITVWFVKGLDWLFSYIEDFLASAGAAAWVSSMLENGIFGGLSAVLGFLPQLVVLFLFLSILEDSGYMARAAFIMDRALRRFGLSGKSFIPMLIGFGCSVPAMASTRTLDRDDDRKVTTMIIPFVSCGAKAPIYGVFAGALFFGYSYLIVFSMYILGLLVAIMSAILFKKTIFKGTSANYLMELPEYRMPTFKNTMLHTWERSKAFLIKAGTILLGAFIIIWFLSYFGFKDGVFGLLDVSDLEYSFLGYFGKFILPVFRPIGFTSWQPTVAILTGIVAKESVVGTLGILYGVTGNAIENGSLLYESIRSAFTPAQAYAFMTFALLASPCVAALSAMRKELASKKWFWFTVFYELIVAYLVSLIIYQVGSLGAGGVITAIVAITAALIVFFTIKRIIRT
ncbi:MAG TPA: ferrous iron transport protein B, partial [Bacillota bacterium]|nr:ferrous iron transport protein B [Bacillota bacterium]